MDTGLLILYLQHHPVFRTGYESPKYSLSLYHCAVHTLRKLIRNLRTCLHGFLFGYYKFHPAVNPHRVHVTLYECIGMLIGSLHHSALYKNGPGILFALLHLLIPGRTYFYNEKVLHSRSDKVCDIKRKRGRIPFMFPCWLPVHPHFTVIIHIGKPQPDPLLLSLQQVKFIAVPPRCLVKISEFSPKIRLNGKQKLQMF